MPGYLIKDTTKEERKQIVEESLGNISANCDGCMARLAVRHELLHDIRLFGNGGTGIVRPA